MLDLEELNKYLDSRIETVILYEDSFHFETIRGMHEGRNQAFKEIKEFIAKNQQIPCF